MTHRPNTPRPCAAADGERHTHRIHLETGPEPVRLTIGEAPARDEAGSAGRHPAIPGGYAKVFARVIDCGDWARLPDVGRAVYLPLVRFADAASGFRVRIGLAALMRYTGLSRSSVKRGLRALLDAHLVTLVKAGGASANGANLTNVYQLLVPATDDDANCPAAPQANPPRRHKSAAAAKRGTQKAKALPGGTDGSARNPLPGPRGTPGAFGGEPPAGSALNPGPVRLDAAPRSIAEPLNRFFPRTPITQHAVVTEEIQNGPGAPAARDRAAAMLANWGVAPAAARALAESHEPQRIAAAVETARKERAAGRLRNPAGFLVRCLAEQWPVTGGPTVASGADQTSKALEIHRSEAEAAVEARSAADAAIDQLDDASLEHIRARVLERHADRPALIRLLTAKPPRESRLMRAEIASLLDLS